MTPQIIVDGLCVRAEESVDTKLGVISSRVAPGGGRVGERKEASASATNYTLLYSVAPQKGGPSAFNSSPRPPSGRQILFRYHLAADR